MLWQLISKLKPIGVPILETYFRTVDRLAMLILRTRGQSTVREVRGAEWLNSEKVVIFAAFPSDKLASLHLRMLNRFQKTGYSVLLVSNHPRPDYVFSECLKEDWAFMFRRPFGRDFGAFKDATLFLHHLTGERGRRFTKVVYLNDSIATIEANEPSIVAHLDDPNYKFAGVTENYHKGLHVGSFAMSVGEDAFYHPRMVRYWKQFKSFSTRRYAISKGELGFSKAMRRAGYMPNVSWTLAKMKQALLELPTERLIEIADRMEPHFRRQIQTPFKVIDDRMASFLGASNLGVEEQSILQSILGRTRKQAKTVAPSADGALMTAAMIQSSQIADDPDRRALRFVRFRERFADIREKQQAGVVVNAARSDLVDAMLAYIFRGSQIHHGASVLLYIGAGLMKKDLVLRRIIEPFDVEVLLRHALGADAPDVSEIKQELLQKGHPYSFTGWTKLMNDWDFT